MTDTFLTFLLLISLMQVGLAIGWWVVDRERPYVPWLSVVLLLFGLADLLEGGFALYPAAAPLLARLYAIVTPLLPVALFGGVLALVRPALMRRGSVVRRVLLGFGGGVFVLAGLDTVLGLGVYYAAAGTPDFIGAVVLESPLAPVVLTFILASLLAPPLLLALALWQGWTPRFRDAQVTLLFTTLASVGTTIVIQQIVSPTIVRALASLVITAGLFILIVTSQPTTMRLLTRMGRDQNIGPKLQRGFGSLVLVTMIVGLLSILALSQLNRQVQQTLTTQNQLAQETTTLLDAYRAARRYERDFALQARTASTEQARASARQRWHGSMDVIDQALPRLWQRSLTPEQRTRVREINTLFRTYEERAEQLFAAYEQRGDVDSGALAAWIQAAEALDLLLNQTPVASREFNERFVDLRNDQFAYLVTENSSLGRDILGRYDELQGFMLSEQSESTPGARPQVQRQLAAEAAAFNEVREATRTVDTRSATLDDAATDLEAEILALSAQFEAAFDASVQTIDESRSSYVLWILSGILTGVVVAALLATVSSQQITTPVLALQRAAEAMTAEQQGVRAEVLTGDEIGTAARAFNAMAGKLESLLFSLEERVARRTAQLETAAQVAAAASAVRTLEPLLDATVALLVERFSDIYHAQVFLIDQRGAGEWAELRASTGEPGRQLLAIGHKLAVGSASVIGRVTATGQHVLARTTDPHSVHRPNPYLPETRSELALPMRREGRVIGALDVQSKQAYAFNEDDVAVLQTLADQLTVAVDNARLFDDLSASLDETELLFQTSNRLAAASSRDDILDIFVGVAEQLVTIDHLIVLFFEEFDAEGQPIIAEVARVWSHADGIREPGTRFDIRTVVDDLRRAVEAGYLEVPDIASYASLDGPLYQALHDLGSQSFAAFPLEASGNYLGLMMIQRQQVGSLPPIALRVFRVLAQQAALAFNRFALLDKLATRVDELQELRESFLEMSASPSLETLLEGLATRAAELMRADAADIYLYDAAQDEMELVALHNMDPALVGRRVPRGEGVVGTLIEQPDPILVDQDSQTAEGATPLLPSSRYGTIAAAPLRWQTRLLGALTTITQHENRRFDQDDLRRLTLFADQAALSVENARLLGETERSLRETASLYRATQALMGTTDEAAMLQALVNNIGNDGDVVMALHAVPDHDPPMLEVVAINEGKIVTGTAPLRRTMRAPEMFPVGRRLPGALLVPEGVVVWEATDRVVEDLATSDVAADVRLAATFGLRSLVAIPIYTREAFYGAIIMLRRGLSPFSAEDVTRASTLVAQFAVAYDNVLLLEESRQAAAQLATAAEVSRAASSLLDVDDLLTRAVNLVRLRFGYYHVQVFLIDPANLWAELKASTGPVGQTLLARRHRLGVGSRSVIGQVTALGQHIVARSEEVDPASVHRRNELLPDTRTELALPMKIGDKVIGALDVQSMDPLAFSDDEDVALLQTLADQLAIAVQNARLFEQSQANLQKSQSLYRAGRAIAAAETLPDILDAILAHVAPPDTCDLSILSIRVDAAGRPTTLQVEAAHVTSQPHRDFTGRTFPLAAEQSALIRALHRERGSITVHDVRNDPRLDDLTRERYLRLGIESVVVTALTKIEETLFVLQVALPTARHIGQEEVERLGTIATQAATAIENQHLLENLATRARRLDALNVLSTQLFGLSTLDDMFRVAAREITQIMDVDQVGIVLFDRATKVGHVVAQHNVNAPPPALGSTIPLEDNAAIDWLEQHRRPLVVNDLAHDPRMATVADLLHQQGIRSILIVPLIVRGELIGTIGLDAIEQPRAWSDTDVALVLALGTVVSAAIESTRLFEQVRRSLVQSQKLYGASRAINEAASPNEIAEAIAAHVVDEAAASVVLVSLSLDADELPHEAEIEGAFIQGGEGQRWQRTRFSDRAFPSLRTLDLHREPLVIEAMPAEHRLARREQRFFALLGVRAMLTAPIHLVDGWRGAILVLFPMTRRIESDEVNRLAAIATQAATTMQNRDLLRQTQASLRESQLLYRAGTAINEAESLEGLLQALYPLAAPVDPDQVVLMLFDEPVLEGERPLNFTALAGLTVREELVPVGQTYRVRDFPIFRRLPVVAPLIFDDVQGSELVSEDERQVLRRLGIRSLLYVPLRIGTRYMGWVGFNAAQPRQIGEETVQRLQTIAQQTATALQSHQLLQEAQRRAWREEQISRITTRLHSTTNPEEIIRIGIQELKRTLHVKRALAWTQSHTNGGNGYPPAEE